MTKIKNNVSQYIKYIPVVFIVGFIFTDIAFAGGNFPTAWKELMDEYKVIVAGITGFGALSSFLIFIVHMFQLATMGSAHPMIRRKILANVLISGVTTALLGGVGLIYLLVYETVFF